MLPPFFQDDDDDPVNEFEEDDEAMTREQQRFIALMRDKLTTGDFHVSSFEEGQRADQRLKQDRHQRMQNQKRTMEEKRSLQPQLCAVEAQMGDTEEVVDLESLQGACGGVEEPVVQGACGLTGDSTSSSAQAARKKKKKKAKKNRKSKTATQGDKEREKASDEEDEIDDGRESNRAAAGGAGLVGLPALEPIAARDDFPQESVLPPVHPFDMASGPDDSGINEAVEDEGEMYHIPVHVLVSENVNDHEELDDYFDDNDDIPVNAFEVDGGQNDSLLSEAAHYQPAKEMTTTMMTKTVTTTRTTSSDLPAGIRPLSLIDSNGNDVELVTVGVDALEGSLLEQSNDYEDDFEDDFEDEDDDGVDNGADDDDEWGPFDDFPDDDGDLGGYAPSLLSPRHSPAADESLPLLTKEEQSWSVPNMKSSSDHRSTNPLSFSFSPACAPLQGIRHFGRDFAVDAGGGGDGFAVDVGGGGGGDGDGFGYANLVNEMMDAIDKSR